jgi:hypothetical protein
MTYSEKLKDPRWQRRRLEVLEAAGWKCSQCESTDQTLHVHHNFYRSRTEPWNYPDHALRVLCEGCHENAEFQRRELAQCIEGLYDSEYGISAVEAVIGFIKATKMQDALAINPHHTELLRNHPQAWGFASYHRADQRDLIERLNNGEVTAEMLGDLWRLQAARLQRRLEIEAKYDEEGAIHAE